MPTSVDYTSTFKNLPYSTALLLSEPLRREACISGMCIPLPHNLIIQCHSFHHKVHRVGQEPLKVLIGTKVMEFPDNEECVFLLSLTELITPLSSCSHSLQS